MTITYLKRAKDRPRDEDSTLAETVSKLLHGLESGGEAEARRLAGKFDGWHGDVVVSAEARQAAIARLSEDHKAPIRFAHDNIRRFAEAQKASLTDFEIELSPGHRAGQKQIPVSAAGCYVPGGRYHHVASALMTITTARVAGVSHVTAASPPGRGDGIPDAVIFAMDLAGADTILTMGGVQAIAAMTFGLFGTVAVDVLAGPGNAFVAEAKRQLFGRVGIDMVAGPTDSLVIADETADALTVAWDLIGQAEHGPDSPVWLVTTDRLLAERVLAQVPELIAELPELNATAAHTSWSERAEVILCDTREEMAGVANDYAPEHLHVQAADKAWWRDRLTAYGSLFLGAETTVPFGDKVSGPNHVLPTSRAARYTGGLSVQKFTKTVTWQTATPEASGRLARATSAICRQEGMIGHARSAEARLAEEALCEG